MSSQNNCHYCNIILNFSEKRRKRGTPLQTTEAPGAAALGTVALIFLGCELALVVSADLTHIRHHIRVMRRNVRDGWMVVSMLWLAPWCSAKNEPGNVKAQGQQKGQGHCVKEGQDGVRGYQNRHVPVDVQV